MISIKAAKPLTPYSRKSSAVSLVERPCAAHERAAPEIEPQSAVRLRRNADSNALSDFPLAGCMVVVREPERAFPAKVEPVERAIDPERLGKPSRSSRQVAQALGSPIALHDRDSFERFERPDQDAGANALRLARNIQHPGNAVGEIDIGVAALEEERAIARRHAPVGMSRRIADDIRLGFDDAADCRAFGQFPRQQLADEKAGERGRIDRQLGA